MVLPGQWGVGPPAMGCGGVSHLLGRLPLTRVGDGAIVPQAAVMGSGVALIA